MSRSENLEITKTLTNLEKNIRGLSSAIKVVRAAVDWFQNTWAGYGTLNLWASGKFEKVRWIFFFVRSLFLILISGAASKPIQEMLKSFLNPDFVGENKEREADKADLKNFKTSKDEKPIKFYSSLVKKDNIEKIPRFQNAETQYNIKDFIKNISKGSDVRENKLRVSEKITQNTKSENRQLKEIQKKIERKVPQQAERKTEKPVNVKQNDDKIKSAKEVTTKDKVSTSATAKIEKQIQKKVDPTSKNKLEIKERNPKKTSQEKPKIVQNSTFLKAQRETTKVDQENTKTLRDGQKSVASSKIGKNHEKLLKKSQSYAKSREKKIFKTTEKISTRTLPKSQNCSRDKTEYFDFKINLKDKTFLHFCFFVPDRNQGRFPAISIKLPPLRSLDIPPIIAPPTTTKPVNKTAPKLTFAIGIP